MQFWFEFKTKFNIFYNLSYIPKFENFVLKVAIGSKLIDGPWGGGNQFVKNLKEYLELNNFQVIHNLLEADIDIILLTEPRVSSSSSSITMLEAIFYRKFINSNVKIIHRINECDERKNTKNVNNKMLKITNKADFTVFVSYWIEDLYRKIGFNKSHSKVIMSGSDKKIFNNSNYSAWDRSSKLKIITHHWGDNWNKGFEVYLKIDKLLINKNFNSKFSFSYVGNLPKGIEFKNTNYKKPLSGPDLANEIKSHHIYITGSLNEPSGNHQIEASQCGLPVMFINSGGIPDYQKDYGIEYSIDNLENKLFEVYENYEVFYKKNLDFPFNSQKMNKEYYDLFLDICDKSDIRNKNMFSFNIFKFFYKLYIIEFIKNLFLKFIYQFNKIKSLF